MCFIAQFSHSQFHDTQTLGILYTVFRKWYHIRQYEILCIIIITIEQRILCAYLPLLLLFCSTLNSCERKNFSMRKEFLLNFPLQKLVLLFLSSIHPSGNQNCIVGTHGALKRTYTHIHTYEIVDAFIPVEMTIKQVVANGNIHSLFASFGVFIYILLDIYLDISMMILL